MTCQLARYAVAADLGPTFCSPQYFVHHLQKKKKSDLKAEKIKKCIYMVYIYLYIYIYILYLCVCIYLFIHVKMYLIFLISKIFLIVILYTL